jgi:hypothetical protein
MESEGIVNGLHSCKPGNEPVVGQVKTFAVIQHPANAQTGKKAWTKIKSASADAGGTPYRITKVSPTGHTDSYGNISFNLDIEPAGTPSGMAGLSTPPAPSPQFTPARRSTNGGSMSKDDYWARKEERDVAAQERMGRCHSQEMALRYWTLLASGGVITPEDCKDHKKLRAMIDWFERDIDRVPTNTQKHHRTKVHHYDKRNTSGNS